MTRRRYGPDCATDFASLAQRHETNHPPHINFIPVSRSLTSTTTPPNSFRITEENKKRGWRILNTLLQSNSYPPTFSSAADRYCSHRPARRCRSACCTTTPATSGFCPKDARTAGKTRLRLRCARQGNRHVIMQAPAQTKAAAALSLGVGSRSCSQGCLRSGR